MPVDLVTGGTGLVGSNLVRSLHAQRRTVRLLVRKTSRVSLFADLPGLQFVEGDITVPESLSAACNGVERVYHLAAAVTIKSKMTDAVWQTNVIGTQNIIQAVQASGARRLIYCSSEDALGLPEGSQSSTEETPWNWDRLGVDNSYARSKYEAHQHVLAAARAGLDTVLVCPGYMFGAYDSHPSSGKMIQAIAGRRLPGYPGGGNNFVAVQDVIQGMISAGQAGRAGEVYVLGGANLSYKEIFTIIARVVGVPPPRVAIPYPIARIAGWFGDRYEQVTGRETDLTSPTVKISYLYHYFDPAKAIRELGMPQTPIETAVAQAAAWLRSQNMLRGAERSKTPGA
jgi:dihydroflavonol-4-reductase